MGSLKYKDPETGEVKRVWAPSIDAYTKTQTDALVTEKADAAESNAKAYTDEQIANIDIPSGEGTDASAQIEAHNTDETAHVDIRSVMKKYQNRSTISGTSIKTWTEAQTVSTCIAADTTVTDMPFDNGYWVVDLDIIANGNWKTLTATQAGNADSIYVRQLINGTWSEWFNIGTADKFLPLTGGTLTGGLTIKKAGYPLMIFTDTKTGDDAYMQLNANNLHICVRDVAEVNDNDRKIVLHGKKSSSNIASALQFLDNTGGSRKIYNIFHAANKPTGTYTGNGSATSRTVATGGIGNACLVWRTGSVNVLLVTPNGALAGYGEDGVKHLEDYIKFVYGTLTITNSSAIVNGSGTTYNYQVL